MYGTIAKIVIPVIVVIVAYFIGRGGGKDLDNTKPIDELTDNNRQSRNLNKTTSDIIDELERDNKTARENFAKLSAENRTATELNGDIKRDNRKAGDIIKEIRKQNNL